jgi:hypothetical protein
MLPTWRDVIVHSEIRKTRLQEAAQSRIFKQLSESRKPDLSLFAEILVRLGTWMENAGYQLKSRYGEVASTEPTMHSLEQGCS